MKLDSLRIHGWRQFGNVDIEFHPRLTVLAGANGAGKSTLLRLISQHFGNQFNILGTPQKNTKGELNYFSGIFKAPKKYNAPDNKNSIGHIKYSNGMVAQLNVPPGGSLLYNVTIPMMVGLDGLFIGSHRPTSNYQAIASIPTNAISVQQAYQAYHQEVQNKYNNNFSQFSPIYRIKEAIVSMATFGPGNENVQGNQVLNQAYNDFKSILSKILPETIGFEDINIRIPDIVIVTRTGEFVLDSASGGLMALIDLAWQIFLYSRDKSDFVAVLDEPENHLHPSMQRVIIGNLLNAFPQVQLIVATHSPFVVSSVRDSSVYVLRYEESSESDGPQRTVFSEKLDSTNKAGTASDILRSVLGVPVTLPLWAEEEIDLIASDFNISEFTAETISNLRSRLEQSGLGDYYAEALGRVAQRK